MQTVTHKRFSRATFSWLAGIPAAAARALACVLLTALLASDIAAAAAPVFEAEDSCSCCRRSRQCSCHRGAGHDEQSGPGWDAASGCSNDCVRALGPQTPSPGLSRQSEALSGSRSILGSPHAGRGVPIATGIDQRQYQRPPPSFPV